MFGRKVKVIEDFAQLDERMRRNEKQMDELRQDLRDLGEKHLKLRGKIYALKLHKPDLEDVPTALTRDDLRKQLAQSGRFVPGKPVSHT